MKILPTDKYSCTRCGTCCKWPGHVRLVGDEADKIAEYLNMTTDEFIDKFTHVTDDRKSLSIIEKGFGHCHFLTEEGCAINPVKPVQCSNFPYKWRFFGWRRKCEMKRNK
jgi:Fe-S-cluster containining protein